MIFKVHDPGPVIFFLGMGCALLYWAAREFQSVCQDKGYRSSRYFWLCLLLPPAGWLLVIALPDRSDAGRTGGQKTEGAALSG